MADFFKGLAVRAGIMRSDEQEKLDNMIEAYAKGGTRAHRDTTELIQVALHSSPDLKARTLDAVRNGYLQSYSDTAVDGVAGAAYHAKDQSMRIPPQVGLTDRAMMEKVFTLGHETEHARSTKGVDYASKTLLPAISALAKSDSVGPRDYTGIIDAYVENTRAEEGRAHIGGFNALASFVINDKHPKPAQLLRDLYEAHPDRMGDFIQKSSDAHPATYKLKEGLKLQPDGLMAYSPENIAAMKVHYADKAQLGAEHMNYRQEAIEFSAGLVKKIETQFAELDGEDRNYVIDPERLRAHPALGLPADGAHRAKGLPDIADLGIAFDEPLIVQPAPVRLAPDDGDHPLFAQALTKVVEYHGRDKLTDDPQELRNLAASLAVSAHQAGLDRIDQVTLSVDKTGVIATQGDGDMARHARVEGIGGMAAPEAENLARLPVIAQVALEQPPQQQAQIVSQVSGISVQKI